VAYHLSCFLGGIPLAEVGVADERLDEAATVAKGLADAIRPPVYLVAPSSIMADEKLDQTKPWHPSLPAADSEGGAGGKAADAEAATGPRRSRAEPGAYPRSSGGESGGELVRLLRDEDTSSEAGGALKPGGLAPVAADSTKVIGAGSANSQRPGCGQPLRPITSHEGSLRGSPRGLAPSPSAPSLGVRGGISARTAPGTTTSAISQLPTKPQSKLPPLSKQSPR